MRFMLATGNAHKLEEFRSILAPWEVVPMPPGVELPPEGVESFADNAAGKAIALAELVVADPAQVALLQRGANRVHHALVER